MNWTIPEFVKRSVWSPAGTRLALGTAVWPRSSKNSTKRRRISAAGSDVIRGSCSGTGVDIGRNGTERGEPSDRPGRRCTSGPPRAGDRARQLGVGARWRVASRRRLRADGSAVVERGG